MSHWKRTSSVAGGPAAAGVTGLHAGTSEDWSGNGIGLDNDGDLLYDSSDPDCQANKCGNKRTVRVSSQPQAFPNPHTCFPGCIYVKLQHKLMRVRSSKA